MQVRGDFDSGSLNLFDRWRKVFCGLVDDSKVMAKDYMQEWPPTQFYSVSLLTAVRRN